MRSHADKSPTMRLRELTAVFALAAPLAAQSFSYTSFVNPPTLTAYGSGAALGNTLRLTWANGPLQGWAWHRNAMPVTAGFDTTFSFRITQPSAFVRGQGMAFVIQDSPWGVTPQGGAGNNLGYAGITNCIAVELDMLLDGYLGDTSANEVSVHTRGVDANNTAEFWSLGSHTPQQDLADGQPHTLRVRYTPGNLDVFVDGATTPSLACAYDLATGGTYANGAVAPAPNFASGAAYVGFSATTTSAAFCETAEILSWSWSSTPLVDACYVGAQGADVLRVNGDNGGPRHTVTLPTWQPFSIDMLSPPNHGNGAPWILLGSLFPNPGSPSALSPVGPMCMEVAPFGIGTLVLADAFSSPNPYLPAGPTPYSIQLPVGAIPFVLDITLQAIVATTASPLAFGVSNAIDVEFRNSPAPTITMVSPLSTQPGQTVQVTGTGFMNGATLAVNGIAVPLLTRTATTMTFAYPAGVPCGSSLQVQNIDGQSVTSALNPIPVVTSTSFGSGPASGGQVLLISGQGFAPGSTVTIGGAAATVRVASAPTLLVVTPPGTPGVASVVITTPGGCVATTSYLYL
jgi:hypothetical protein